MSQNLKYTFLISYILIHPPVLFNLASTWSCRPRCGQHDRRFLMAHTPFTIEIESGFAKMVLEDLDNEKKIFIINVFASCLA